MKNNILTRMLIIIPMIIIAGILYAIDSIDLINYFTICAFIIAFQIALITKERDALVSEGEQNA